MRPMFYGLVGSTDNPMEDSMKTKYARIIVQILADEEDVNGPGELELSDAVYELEEKLVEWLKEQAGHLFTFDVRES